MKNQQKSNGGKKKKNSNGNADKGKEFASEIKGFNNDYVGKSKKGK